MHKLINNKKKTRTAIILLLLSVFVLGIWRNDLNGDGIAPKEELQSSQPDITANLTNIKNQTEPVPENRSRNRHIDSVDYSGIQFTPWDVKPLPTM